MEGEPPVGTLGSGWSGRVPVPLVFIGVLVSLATLLFGGGTFLTYRAEARRQREGLYREIATISDQFATSLVLPMWYLDHQQLDQILDHAMDNPLIWKVTLTFQEGGLEPMLRERGDDRGMTVDSTLIESERKIWQRGRVIGRVQLSFTNQYVEDTLRASLRQSLRTLLGLDLLLVGCLTLLLWVLVLRPLREIQRLARVVSSGADLDSQPSSVTFIGAFASVHRSLVRTFELLKQDIAYRKVSEAALLEREKRYRTLFELGPDGIVVLEPETARILEFNDQACRQLGYTREEFQHLSMTDLEGCETEAETRLRILKVMETGREEFLTLQRTRNGELRDVHVTAQYLQVGGAPTYHCVWRDITLERAHEAELKKLQAQLLQAQKMESLGLLAGGVAHDMNNVLGSILGLASAFVGAQPDPSPLHQALETICKAAERGGKMVKSLLSFARHAPAEQRSVDMNELIQEQSRLLARTTLTRIHLELDLGTHLRTLQGDAGALSHALMNLCVNAVDAMPDGGTLTLRTRNLHDDRIEVVVQDSGTGMPQEVLDKALDPFFTTKEVGKGTGLGLSMVYSTVKAHRGTMDLQSEPGQGTRVEMRFPAGNEASASPAAAPSCPARPPHRARQVLLVDDDELIQCSMQNILDALGHTVKAERSGEAALAALESGLEADLVILDMNMPGLGGAGTLPRLRALRPSVPILLSTGRVDQAVLVLASEWPGVTLLAKPFGLRELQKQLEALGLG